MPINLNRFDAIIDSSDTLDPPVNGGVRATQFKWNWTEDQDPQNSPQWTEDEEGGKYIMIDLTEGTKDHLIEYFNELTVNSIFRGNTGGNTGYEVDYQIFQRGVSGRMTPTTNIISHIFNTPAVTEDNLSVVKFTDTDQQRKASDQMDMQNQISYKPFNNTAGFFFPVVNNDNYQKTVVVHNGISTGKNNGLEPFLYVRVKATNVGQDLPEFNLTIGGVN